MSSCTSHTSTCSVLRLDQAGSAILGPALQPKLTVSSFNNGGPALYSGQVQYQKRINLWGSGGVISKIKHLDMWYECQLCRSIKWLLYVQHQKKGNNANQRSSCEKWERGWRQVTATDHDNRNIIAALWPKGDKSITAAHLSRVF